MEFFTFMDKVLENSFIPLYGITLVFSIIRYSKYYDTPLKFIPVLLLYTLLTEILGYIISRNEAFALLLNDAYTEYNLVIYNIYNILFFGYFHYLFWRYLRDGKHRQIVRWGGILFLLAAVVNPFFQSLLLGNQIHAYTVGAVVLIGAIFLFWKELYPKTPGHLIKNNTLFWFSCGLFIFYTGYLPIRINRHFHIVNQTNEAGYLRKIQLLLIVLMYSCFIIGFWRMKRKLLLSQDPTRQDQDQWFKH